MNKQNFQQEIIYNIRGVLEPIIASATSETARKLLLKNIGWSFESIEDFPVSELKGFLNDVSNTINDIEGFDQTHAPNFQTASAHPRHLTSSKSGF